MLLDNLTKSLCRKSRTSPWLLGPPIFINTTAVGPFLPTFVSVLVLSVRFMYCRQLTRGRCWIMLKLRPTISIKTQRSPKQEARKYLHLIRSREDGRYDAAKNELDSVFTPILHSAVLKILPPLIVDLETLHKLIARDLICVKIWLSLMMSVG